MRLSIGTTTLLEAILLAVPPSAISFTLPTSAKRVRVPGSSISRSYEYTDLDLETQEDIGTLTSSTSSSKNNSTTSFFDPADGFNAESYSDLIGMLKEAEEEEDNDDDDIIYTGADLEVSSSSDETRKSVGDIIQDFDGNPLSKEYFAKVMGVDNVESYTCPEKDAFRGFMSNACRVHLNPGGETAFYKHIVFATLDHAQEKFKNAPHKLVRDAKSYQVVASFLLSKACQDMVEKTGVQIPRCYDAKIEPDYDHPMESKFSFLFEDFAPSDGWYQQWLLDDVEECKAALSTFAKIHAYFWHGSSFWKNENKDAAQELEAGVWKSGSYVQPKAQNVNQCKIVAREWATKRMKFEKELSSFDYWDNLGERLESMAEECGRLAHPFAYNDELSKEYQKYRTFTHGDPKQANLLFRKTDEKLQLGLIDFQWAGFGLAASDIAHFLTSAVHADTLVNGGEEMLLRYYFDELQQNLVDFGAFDTAEDAIQEYSYNTFMDQYEIGVLDICRLLIAYTWARFTEPVEKDDEAGKSRTMNKTSYNKSIPNVVWLMTRCDEIMKSRGV